MFIPWRKVYSSTYLTKEGWVPPTIPTDEFFSYRASSVFCPLPILPNNLRVSVMFGRKHHYRMWREWLPWFKPDPVSYFMIVQLNKQRPIVEADGMTRFTKSFEMDLTSVEAFRLHTLAYKEIPESIAKRIAAKIVFDSEDLDGREWRDIYR
jgi:hypothetical protein